MSNLHGNIKDKNKKIARLKLVVADLNQKIIEKDNEINQLEETPNSNKDKAKDTQKRIKLTMN